MKNLNSFKIREIDINKISNKVNYRKKLESAEKTYAEYEGKNEINQFQNISDMLEIEQRRISCNLSID